MSQVDAEDHPVQPASTKDMSSGEDKSPVGEPETHAKASEECSDKEKSAVDKSFGDGKPQVDATGQSFVEPKSPTDNLGDVQSQARTTDESSGKEKSQASSTNESSGKEEKPLVNTTDNSLGEAESQMGTTEKADQQESQIDTTNYSSGEPQLQSGATNKLLANEKSQLNDTGKNSDGVHSPVSAIDKLLGEENTSASITVKSSGIEKSHERPPEVSPVAEVLQEGPPEVSTVAEVLQEGPPEVSPVAEVLQEGPPEVSPLAEVLQEGPPEVSPVAEVLQEEPPEVSPVAEASPERPPEVSPVPEAPQERPPEVSPVAEVLQEEPPEVSPVAEASQERPPEVSPVLEAPQERPPEVSPIAETSSERPPEVSPVPEASQERPPEVSPVAEASPERPPEVSPVPEASPERPPQVSPVVEASQESPPEKMTDKPELKDIRFTDQKSQKVAAPELKRRPLATYSGAGSKSPSSSGRQESQRITTVRAGDLEPPSDTEERGATNYTWLIIGGGIVFALVFALHSLVTQSGHPVPRDNVLDIFFKEFASLKNDFPGQYEGLWFRSEKLLQKHLNASDPSSPTILILTAARDAEKSLLCVSKRLAKSYADSLSAKWILVYGPDEANSDSATSKMKIDDKLSAGFQSDSRAAVLYRLETLPSGSLLILYKYCDHENAAFKNVALVLTVLLEEQSLQRDLSFPEVEEKVKDFLWERFASSEVSAHNEMDVDKLSGVWSRISHVVLPVLPVEAIENGVCPGIKD